jgi:3-oxoacyl-[acyl-carrier-protein] synthase-3
VKDMTQKYTNLKSAMISGIVTCLPKARIENDYFLNFLSKEEIINIEKMAGVKSRYWVENESTVDLCVFAARELINKLNWLPSQVDAIIFISQSPDYVLPASSIKIAGQLGIGQGVIAYDVNLGCSGYPYGLFLAESMISTGIAKKILLLVGETTSKIIDKKDKSTAMIFGDAGSATALETNFDDETIYILGSDASGVNNLIVPNSRFCNNTMLDDCRMIGKNHNYIFMDGAEVFNFTLKQVPPLVSKSLELSDNNIDYFLFHQANKFMLNHLIKKMKINPNSAPCNISEYGNTSSATIPLLLTTSLREILKLRESTKLAMYGFGVGYSWSACVKNVKKDIILENIFFSI